MHLLEIRDLASNDLLTTYDVTAAVDAPDYAGVLRAVQRDMPATACCITIELDEPRGPLTALPAAIAEDTKA
jgi:hypothetical protein